MSIDHSEVGKKIKFLREKKGWTQDEFGALIGISQSKMNKIETGFQKKYEPEIITKIAEKLGVTTDFLFGRDDIPNMTQEEKDEAEFLAFKNDPTLQKWYKELPQSEEEDLQKLRKMWEFIKNDF